MVERRNAWIACRWYIGRRSKSDRAQIGAKLKESFKHYRTVPSVLRLEFQEPHPTDPQCYGLRTGRYLTCVLYSCNFNKTAAVTHPIRRNL
jgi:hypothetical protein